MRAAADVRCGEDHHRLLLGQVPQVAVLPLAHRPARAGEENAQRAGRTPHGAARPVSDLWGGAALAIACAVAERAPPERSAAGVSYGRSLLPFVRVRTRSFGVFCSSVRLAALPRRHTQIVGVSVDPKKSAVEKHIKKATKYTPEMGTKQWTGGKTDLCLCYDEDSQVKKAFNKLTKMDAFMAPSVRSPAPLAAGRHPALTPRRPVPPQANPTLPYRTLIAAVAAVAPRGPIGQAFIVNGEGKVVWRQSFSAGFPYTHSRFESQLKAVMAGGELYSFGPNPKPPEEEEELEGYGSDEEAGDVFSQPAADGAW